MMHAFREVVIGGVLVAPIVRYVVATLVVIVVLRPALYFIGFSSLFSNPPVAELSLYLVIFGLLTVLL